MKNFTLLTTLMLIALLSHAQWEWQNPLPQGNSIYGISFVDENNGWAVGSGRTILHTTDGGVTWDMQESGFADYYYGLMLKDVCFTDTSNGWIVGGMPGFILHTEDGGQTWSSSDNGGTRLPSSKTDVYFVDQQTGWVLGWAASLDSVYIRRTTDAGLTWYYHTICELPATYDGGLYFVNNMEGWVVWGSKIMHTADGGMSWETQYDEGSGNFNDVFFIDSENGWVVGREGTVLFTSNGGEMWEPSNDSSLSGIYLRDVSFINTETGWVGGYYDDDDKNGAILKTTNGGVTWENQISGAEIKSIYCLTFENGSGGFAAGDLGEMLVAANAGDDWDIISSRFTECDFRDVFFADADNGWAVGGLDSGDVSTPEIYHTGDGGITWLAQEVPYSENNYLYNAFFTDPQHGWALGRDAYYGGGTKLICTTDGGNQWELQSTEDIGGDIYFISQSIGWRVGVNGIIQKTIDGGWNWVDQTSVTNANLTSLCFLNDETGWIAGDSIVLNTTDGGQTWVEQSSGIYLWSDIFFIDKQHGWVVGPGWGYGCGKIMKTIDGGQTWVEIYDCGFHEVFFTDSVNGWGRSRTDPGGGASSPPVSNIWKTHDGGFTWELQPLPALIYGGFCFSDANNGWAVSSRGTILHTSNGGATGFEEIQIQNSVFDIKTYPNPFTTSTTIEYELQQPATVQITIYNHLGKQVAVFAPGNQGQGMHTFSWQPHNLQAGVYYCVLKTDKETKTVKMVKMK